MIADRRGLVLGSDVRMTRHGHVVPVFSAVVIVFCLQRLGSVWQAGELSIRLD